MKTTRMQRAKRLYNTLGWNNPNSAVVAAINDALKLEGRIKYRSGFERGLEKAISMLDGPDGERAQMKAYGERLRTELTSSKASIAGLLKERDAAIEEVASLKRQLATECDVLKSTTSTLLAKCEAVAADLDAMRNDRNRYADVARERFEEIAKLNACMQEPKSQDPNAQAGHVSCWKRLGEVQRELDEQRTCSERLEKYAFNARAQYEECRDKFGETLKTLDVTARERDTLRLRLEILQRTSDSAVHEQDTLRRQLESVRTAHDSLIRERDVALSDVTRLTKERDLLISQKMPSGNVRVPWAWRVEHVGSTFDSTKQKHADGCFGAYKDSDADYSGCIPSCPVAIAYLAKTTPKVAPILPSSLRDGQRIEWTDSIDGKRIVSVVDYHYPDQSAVVVGGVYHLHDRYASEYAITILEDAPTPKRETLIEAATRTSAPIKPSSLKQGHKIEWTVSSHYDHKITGEVVYVGANRANVRPDCNEAITTVLFDQNASVDAIRILSYNNPHAECERKLAEARESLRSARAEYEQRLLEVAQSRSFVSDQFKTSIGETKAAERERDTALRSLNKTRSELAAVHKQLVEERSIGDTCAFDKSALIKERDALQFRVNAQAAEIKRLNERMEKFDVLDKTLADSERELAMAREYCRQHRDERDAKEKYCRELQALFNSAVSELAQAKAVVESRGLTIEKARIALAATERPVTERPEFVQVPDSFKSPFDSSHSTACYGAPHSGSQCIRDCRRRLAWEAAGCPSP